jgi:NAD(P)-dependent dehydrogenase (short-subunit alcohol dehydrogenase family)
MSLISLLKGVGPSGFGNKSTAEEVTQGVDLSGKIYLLTGCASGLGMETLRVLCLRGAHVLGSARTIEAASQAMQTQEGKTTPVACDLSEPSSVKTCVETVKALDVRLDGIICNAGVMALPRLEIKHGLEMQFFVNHIGHFMLVTGLLDKLADDGRVVMLSSAAHKMAWNGIDFDNLDGKKGYGAWKAYGESKLANLLFAKQLAKRFEGSKQVADAVHPGVIKTNLWRHTNPVMKGLSALLGPIFLKTPAQGAATACYAAVHPDVASISGKYFADSNIAKPGPKAEDPDLASRLWEESEAIVARIAGQ